MDQYPQPTTRKDRNDQNITLLHSYHLLWLNLQFRLTENKPTDFRVGRRFSEWTQAAPEKADRLRQLISFDEDPLFFAFRMH